EPFLYGGERDKKRGLNWEGLDRDGSVVLASFLDKATNPNPKLRFANVSEAMDALKPRPSTEPSIGRDWDETAKTRIELGPQSEEPRYQPEIREQHVEWLRSILQSYPGSQWGNRETRGLDTEFAVQ